MFLAGIEPDHPLRMAFGGKGDVRRRHGIVTGFDPAARFAPVAQVALGALADQIEFDIPLPIAVAIGAAAIERATARPG